MVRLVPHRPLTVMTEDTSVACAPSAARRWGRTRAEWEPRTRSHISAVEKPPVAVNPWDGVN